MTIKERVEAHDRQIAGLITAMGKQKEAIDALQALAETHDAQIEGLLTAVEKQQNEIAGLVREWQAYLRTIRPQ